MILKDNAQAKAGRMTEKWLIAERPDAVTHTCKLV